MSQHVTVRGFVATDPVIRNAAAGFPVGNFRLAATDRRFDREQNAWVDGQTNWFTVNMFRGLAQNAYTSLQKGQPVVVTGRLRVRPWETEDRSGTAVEIEADGIGHDLSLGTATFQRSSARVGDLPGMSVNRATGEIVDEDPEGGPGSADGADGGSEGAAGQDAEDPASLSAA